MCPAHSLQPHAAVETVSSSKQQDEPTCGALNFTIVLACHCPLFLDNIPLYRHETFLFVLLLVVGHLGQFHFCGIVKSSAVFEFHTH